MIKKLEGLQWKPMWVSHLGCIKGCLEYLKLSVSDAWLFGGTGHAFIVTMHKTLCPSGPTSWSTEKFLKLGCNLGYFIEGVWGWKGEKDFALKQKIAWDNTKRAIDRGIPCYGWELEIPEFSMVYGYDESGYFYSGVKDGLRPWQELGNTKIGILEMHYVETCNVTDDLGTVKEAFEFVLEHARSPRGWLPSGYKTGLCGFDIWINALEKGSVNAFGMAYNSAVWSECRHFAVEFLKEAKMKIGGKYNVLLEEAIKHYEDIAYHLNSVSALFPLPPKSEEIQDAKGCDMAVKHLRKVRKSEEAGLAILEKIVVIS